MRNVCRVLLLHCFWIDFRSVVALGGGVRPSGPTSASQSSLCTSVAAGDIDGTLDLANSSGLFSYLGRERQYVERLLLDLAFFIVVNVIFFQGGLQHGIFSLLELGLTALTLGAVVLAVIVNGFDSHRDYITKREENKATVCTVCGVDKKTFDREVDISEGTFQDHVSKSHDVSQ